MPRWDFKCRSCPYEEEVSLSKPYAIPDTTPCPVCNDVMDRQFPRTTFVLKGEGWTPKGNE